MFMRAILSQFQKTRVRQQGLKGPTQELIEAVVEMKRRNCTWGCKQNVQQIALASGVEIDKEVVWRILGIHFRPETGSEVRHGFPYWSRQKLAVVLFRRESALLSLA